MSACFLFLHVFYYFSLEIVITNDVKDFLKYIYLRNAFIAQ